jgi:hypothetical protein
MILINGVTGILAKNLGRLINRMTLLKVHNDNDKSV